MSKVLTVDLVVSLLLVVVVITGTMVFAGGVFTNYNTTLSTYANQSITNVSSQTSGIVTTSQSIYDGTLNSPINDIPIIGGIAIWISSSVTAIKTAVTGVGQVKNVGNALTTNLGVDASMAGLIILAITITIVLSYVATMFGREEV
jgi:hypothetical protein